MDLVSIKDAEIIAHHTQELIEKAPQLKMIGLMPRDQDYRITNIWCAFSTMPETNISYNNIIITTSLSEVQAIINDNLKVR